MFDAIVAHALIQHLFLKRLIQNMQVWVKVLGGGSFVNMFQERLKVMQGDTLRSQTAVQLALNTDMVTPQSLHNNSMVYFTKLPSYSLNLNSISYSYTKRHFVKETFNYHFTQ